MTKKILVVSPGWLGDAVMSHALIKQLCFQYPGSTIHVLVGNNLSNIYVRMQGVARVIPMGINHGDMALRRRYKIACDLREEQYDMAFVLPNSWKSALIPFFARIPIRIGWLGEWRYKLLTHWKKLNKSIYHLMVTSYLQLADFSIEPSNFNSKLLKSLQPQLEVDINHQQEVITKFVINMQTQKPIAALCPGAAFGPSKAWPARHYAKLANLLLANGWKVWLLGSMSDKPAAETIQFMTHNRCHDFVGITNLNEAVDILGLSDIVITNDSGLMHVAAALNKNIVAIYGSTSKDATPALTNQATNLSTNLACQPCRKRTCKYGTYKCLNDITPEQVFREINNFNPCTIGSIKASKC